MDESRRDDDPGPKLLQDQRCPSHDRGHRPFCQEYGSHCTCNTVSVGPGCISHHAPMSLTYRARSEQNEHAPNPDRNVVFPGNLLASLFNIFPICANTVPVVTSQTDTVSMIVVLLDRFLLDAGMKVAALAARRCGLRRFGHLDALSYDLYLCPVWSNAVSSIYVS